MSALRAAVAAAGLAVAGCAAPPEPVTPTEFAFSVIPAGLLGGVNHDEDRVAAAMAQQAALEEWRPVEWLGSGILGRIEPLERLRVGGRQCGRFAHVVVTPAVAREWRGEACRDQAGQWIPIR